MSTDITFCRNEQCAHRINCARGSTPVDPYYSVTEFKTDKDGKCDMFMMKSSEEIGYYYDAIPVPLILDLEVLTEPDDLPPTMCYGCRQPTSHYAQVTTKQNYINLCDVCVGKLDDVSFRSRRFETGSLSQGDHD